MSRILFNVEPIIWKWSPTELSSFLAGTQSWLVELSVALAQRGHDVSIVYDGEDQAFQGVSYRSRGSWSDDCDVYIFWNHPLGTFKSRPNAKRILYWTNGDDFQTKAYPAHYPFVDTVVAMSNFHRDEHSRELASIGHRLHYEVIGAGISSVELRDPGVTRVRNRFLYASSWDRGLVPLLQMWPRIKRHLPDAELHLTYGRELAAKVGVPMDLPPQMPGLVVHEAVTRADMVNFYRSSDMMLYASKRDKKMAYCMYLTALKAQVLGCLPVTTHHIAVDDAIYRGIQVHSSAMDDAIIFLSQNDKEREVMRANLAKVHTPSWDEIAEKWESLF